MKSISISNVAITENTEHLIIKVCALVINLKVEVLLSHSVSLRFVSKHVGYHSKHRKRLCRSAFAQVLH